MLNKLKNCTMQKSNSTTIPLTFPWETFTNVYCVRKNPFVCTKIPQTAPDGVKITGINKRILENLCLLAFYKKSNYFEKIFFYIKTNWHYDMPSIGFINGKIAYINDLPVIETGINQHHKEILEQRILPHIQKALLQSQ